MPNQIIVFLPDQHFADTVFLVLFEGLDFQIRRGERVFLSGENGCGKSSLIHAIMQKGTGEMRDRDRQGLIVEGTLDVVSGLVICTLQDTSDDRMAGGEGNYGRI